MRIIKNGWNAEDGIYCSCPVCMCEYVIENRDDFIVGSVYDLIDDKFVACYTSKCPQCDMTIIDHAINPNNASYNLLTKYKPIFDRKDWKEKYEVLI